MNRTIRDEEHEQTVSMDVRLLRAKGAVRGSEESEVDTCRVIAIANQKGGVGKTTTTVNLGVGLAKRGAKVLLVDLDPQGNLTSALGWKEKAELQFTIGSHINAAIADERMTPKIGLLHSDEGVDIMPANLSLAATEAAMVNAMCRERLLASWLDKVKEDYDYVLIDCGPSLGMLTINALAAADSVLIPVEARHLGLEGMTDLLNSVKRVRSKMNPSLDLEGVLLTLYDARTAMAKDVQHEIRIAYSSNVFRCVIPVLAKLGEAPGAGMSIFSYDPSGRGSVAYDEVAQEVIENGAKQKTKAKSDITR